MVVLRRIVVGGFALSALGGVLSAGLLSQPRALAAADRRCPPDQSSERVDRAYGAPEFDRYYMEGCGQANRYSYDGNDKRWTSPLDRAAFELTCPRAQLTVVKISGDSYGVSGCEKR